MTRKYRSIGVLQTLEDQIGGRAPVDWIADQIGLAYGRRTLSLAMPFLRSKDVCLPSICVIHVCVNHGRWIVHCPCKYNSHHGIRQCAGAQLASRNILRFFCVDCQNAFVGGKWIPVVWPPNIDEIDAALGVRPLCDMRNWLPGEPIEALHAENAIYLDGHIS